MDYLKILELGANFASIITALLAAWAYGRYTYERRQKRKRLEDYLKQQKYAGGAQAEQEIMHLIAELGMTEADTIDAAFRSRCIVRTATPAMHGIPSRLLLK